MKKAKRKEKAGVVVEEEVLLTAYKKILFDQNKTPTQPRNREGGGRGERKGALLGK